MYSSEEEIASRKEKSLIISIRLNKEEQAVLAELKQMLNLHQDGTAVKVAMQIGRNVLHGTFGSDILKYLTDPSRRRPEQEG